MQKILIKHSPNINSEALSRQISSDFYNKHDVRFTFDSNDDYDWLVALHHSSIENQFISKVPKSKCIYISMEPSEKLTNVSPKFINQFGTFVSSDRNIYHQNQIYKNIHNWWVGLTVKIHNSKHHIIYSGKYDYDYFKINNFNNKINKISVISSSKILFDGHQKRNDLISKLMQSEISEYIDIYGKGFIPFNDKIDVIAKYKYHLVIENSSSLDYWSEKLADVYLCNTFPIYYGCPNIGSYFSNKSIVRLENLDSSYVISILKKIINNNDNNIYNIESLEESKNLVLEKYNLFNFIESLCQNQNSEKGHYKLNTNSFFIHGSLYMFLKKIYSYLKS